MSNSETITRTDLTNILNEVLPNTSVDYIVEQGTSGDWTYRKWNSGVAECWGIHTGTTNIATTWGSMYVCSAITILFPSGLFTNSPIVSGSNAGGLAGIFIAATTVSKDSVNVQLARGPSASNANYSVNIHAYGTWK